MKTKIISIVVMLLMAVNVMGEDLAYFYLNNGRCIPLSVSVLSKMEVSKIDMNNIQHSDYQTQKIVTNDTTVFISLSEIDSIVFDKKEITDYPKTEKEIKESIDLSNSIASKSKQIVDSLADLGEMDINVIVEEIRKLDGVIVANADSSQSVINIIQKDGICINKLMKIDESTYIDENEEVYYKSISPKLSPSPRRIEMSQGDNASYLASHGQALILAPFQSSFGKYMNYFREQFEYAYDKGPIVYENHSADILKFKGDNLSKYDFLFIDTHGGCGSFMAPRSDYQNGWVSWSGWSLSTNNSTVLLSRSEYNYDFVDHYVNKEKLLTWDQIFIEDIDGQLYLAMDHSFIDGYSFDGCIVFASACLAGRDKTSDTSLMKAFLDNGAALYAGFEVVINSAVCESIDTGIIGLFAHGVSFQDAKQYWINSRYLKKTVDTARETGLCKEEELDPQRFVYRVNPKLSNSKIFLKNPYPSLYSAVVDKETIGFAWETELEGFTTYSQTVELVNFQERTIKKNRFNVQFNLVNDLYVDGKLYKCANEEKALTIPANEFSVGDHSWYVTSSLYDDENNIVCTYSSKEEKFNIPEPLQNLVISQNNVVVNPGSTTTVEITSGNGDYTVSVDKPSIATASVSGTTITIKGVSAGTAKVTVKDKSGQTAEINVNVWDNLSLSQSSVGIYAGYSATVEITSGSEHYTVSVDKPAIATASLSGSVITIKGVGVGSAVVTVTDTSTNQTAKINVTVSSAPTLVVSNSSVELMVGGSSIVEITSGSGSYEISNSNVNVAQAVLDGTKITLTAKAEGNAVVTVKDKVTSQTAEIKVSVYSSHTMAETFYKMPTFTTIQDANTTPVTAPGTGTNPITVQNTRTNNTPRYLYTTWGEDGWANANDELPETGYCFSCYFTIVADAGVSNCLEFALLPIDVTVPANHLKLLNTADYFFRFHQAVNSVDGKDSIWVNGDVVNNANWNQGERNGEATVLKVGTKYHIRVDVVGAEAKSTIASEKGEVVYSGTKDISALPNTKMGTLWFNTSGACTYQFDDVKLSYLPHAPFAIKPTVEPIACIDTKRDFYVKYEKGTALHWILPGEETEAEGSPVSFTDGKMGRDFEADPNLAGGAWIIECFESGTLKCWTSLEEDESCVSDVVETDVVCETIHLPMPSASLTNVTVGYGKTYILIVDNTEIPFRPTVTIHYVLKDAAGKTLAEGNKMSGETIDFTAEGSLDLYAFDNSHPTEWYGRSETVTINNDVEYVLATSKDYQWTKEVCDGTVEGFTRLEIVDSENKSHWDRVYSTQYYGYDADGNIICSNGSWSTGKAEKDVVFWKRGFGFFDKSVIGTENCKWNVQVPNDIYTGFLPLVPESSVGWTANAWSIFPLEGIVYYATTAYLTSGLCPIHLQEKYTSNDPYKQNFYVIHKRGDYDCPDKGDCNSTEVVVAGDTFYLHWYDTAINSVEVYTYKGFVAGF